MNVVLINGSPKVQGNTALLLQQMAEVFIQHGVSTTQLHVGKGPVHGCIACGVCRKEKNLRCSINEDLLNEVLPQVFAADGIVVGSPVYFAGMTGTLKCFLDRLFYVAGADGSIMRHKVAGGVVVMRRGGGTTAVDSIHKYFQYANMILPGSNYWNIAYGNASGEVLQDVEGLQTACVLAENMAWTLKALKAGLNEVSAGPLQAKVPMSFIR